MKIANDYCNVSSGINFKNVYLYNNRIITTKEVDRYINKISREAKITEIKDSFKKFIKSIFNK